MENQCLPEVQSQFSDEVKHHFSEVVDSIAKIGGWVVDLATESVKWSRQSYRLHEVKEGTNISLKNAVEYFDPSYRQKITSLYLGASKEAKPFQFEARINTDRQNTRWVKVHGKPVLDEFGKPTQVVGIYEDVTKHIGNFNHIQSQKRFLQSIVDNVMEGLVVVNDKGMIRSFNSSAEQMFGYAEQEIKGKNIVHLMCQQHAKQHFEHLKLHGRTRLSNLLGAGREVVGKRNDNSVFPLHLTVSDVSSSGHNYYLCTARDLTKEKAQAKEIDLLANYDDLTGMPNRNYLERYLTKLSRVERSALVLVNIDRFKRISLAYGNNESNKVIQAIAKRLVALNKEQLITFKDSGNRFWLVVENYKDFDELESLLNEVKQVLEAPIAINDYFHYITVSMGVVLSKPDLKTVSMPAKAELALNDVKRKVNSTFSLYENTKHQESILHAYNTERQLRIGIANKELVFHLQPKYSNEGALESAELLVRWQKSEDELLYPDSFIDVAEESGLIAQIGEQALEAAAHMLSLIRGFAPNVTLAVNISPTQFLQDDFVDKVVTTFERHKVDLRYLIIEITENLFASNFDLIKRKTHDLTELGVKVSIDDFGTGYSNLKRIQELTISEIKIDRSFLWHADTEKGHRLLSAMVNVGKSMKLNVVAEGVESQQHIDTLKAIGVDSFQGYFFSKPISFEAFVSRYR